MRTFSWLLRFILGKIKFFQNSKKFDYSFIKNDIIAFALTQSSLQWPFFFFLFLILFLDELTKNCLRVLNLSLPKTHVTSIGPASLDTLANAFVSVLCTVIYVL